jgi:hypothetical protein
MRSQAARTVAISALALGLLAGARRAPDAAPHMVDGCVTDGNAGLPGAVVRLVELGRSSTPMRPAPSASPPCPRVASPCVYLPGFARLHREIGVPLEAPLLLTLGPEPRFTAEVSVTAAPWTQRPMETAQQTDVVDTATARRESIASVGEALSGVPGVAFIPTGNALGTPVVHAPLPFAPGGQALFHGEVTPSFASNAQEWTGRARVEGAFSGFGWRVDALRRVGGDIRTPEGTLDNTDFAQTNASVMAGRSGTWGSDVRLAVCARF